MEIIYHGLFIFSLNFALNYTNPPDRLKILFQVNELAAGKPEFFEKGKHINGIPHHRGIDGINPFFLVDLADPVGKPKPEPLTHMVGVDTNGHNPGTFPNARLGAIFQLLKPFSYFY